jgi:hypothetical protein
MQLLNHELLPHVTSSVERFLANPDGEAVGMILFNGVEVHFATYLSGTVRSAVQVGDRITVYGVLPRVEPMIVAALIETSDGTRIEDPDYRLQAGRGMMLARLPSLASSQRASWRTSCAATAAYEEPPLKVSTYRPRS